MSKNPQVFPSDVNDSKLTSSANVNDLEGTSPPMARSRMEPKKKCCGKSIFRKKFTRNSPPDFATDPTVPMTKLQRLLIAHPLIAVAPFACELIDCTKNVFLGSRSNTI